jgi:HTH-type transcriptional regulator / antitoxin HigA
MAYPSLHTAAEYEQALLEIARFSESAPEKGTVEAARFDTLAAMIEAYEVEHWPIESIT